MPRGVEVGTGGERVLVVLPGFVIPARSYTGLASALDGFDPGLRVVVPQLYRIGPGVLTGRYSVAQEGPGRRPTWWPTLPGRGCRCGWPATPGVVRWRGWQQRSSSRSPGPRDWS